MRTQNKIDIFNVNFDDIPFWRKPRSECPWVSLGFFVLLCAQLLNAYLPTKVIIARRVCLVLAMVSARGISGKTIRNSFRHQRRTSNFHIWFRQLSRQPTRCGGSCWGLRDYLLWISCILARDLRWTPPMRQPRWRVKRDPAGSLRRVDAGHRCRREPQGNRYIFNSKSLLLMPVGMGATVSISSFVEPARQTRGAEPFGAADRPDVHGHCPS